MATRGGGLARWDGERVDTFTIADGLPSNDIYALEITQRGELVVGTRAEGATLCTLPDLESCRPLGEDHGLPDGSIHDLLEDREGVLWLALNDGLAMVPTAKLQSYTEREGLPDAKVYCVLPEGRDRVWVGTYRGLVRLDLSGDEPKATRWTTAQGLPADAVWAVLRDRAGRLWVATAGGLCQLEAGRGCVEVPVLPGRPRDTQVLALAEDGSGALWVGTASGLVRLLVLEDGDVSHRLWTTDDGLAGNAVPAVAVDSGGRVWAGSGGQGVSVLDGGRWRTVDQDDGLVSDEISSLLPDSGGGMWVGTNGGGVARVRIGSGGERRLEMWGRSHGVIANVSALLGCDSGGVWLGTNRGVQRLQPGAAHLGPVRIHFDRAGGLAGSEVHDLAAGSDGRLWIACSGGVTVYDPALEATELPPPRTAIERLQTAAGTVRRAPFTVSKGPGEGWLGDEPVELAPNDHEVRIELRVVSSRPSDVRAVCRLVGFEDGWVPVGSGTVRTYTNLDPGGYVFQVRARRVSDRLGRWGETAQVELKVRPAIWETWQFALVTGVLLVGLLVTGYRARTQRMRRRTRRLEAVVGERTDDIRRYAHALEAHATALDRANRTVRQGERAMAEFLASVSHDLRTPLNSILGFADLLLERDLEPERQARFLGYIRSSGTHLLELINGVLDLSKVEAGRMPVDLVSTELEPLLRSACEAMHGASSRRDVAVQLRVEGSLPMIVTDESKLRQIVFNLLSNAVKFSPDGERVEVMASWLSERHSALGVPAYVVSVRDHGPGIPEEERATVFEPFRQLPGAGAESPGTGLGLTIVKRFIDLLGGHVSVACPEEGGTVFRVELPVSPDVEDASSGAREPQVGLAEPRTQAVVMVVDSRGRFADLARELEPDGWLPVRAGGAEDAARMTRTVRPAAVVLELDTSDAAAWGVLSVLGSEPNLVDLPVVVWCQGDSGVPRLAVAVHSVLLGPVEPRTLARAVERLAGGGGESARVVAIEPGERLGSALQELGDLPALKLDTAPVAGLDALSDAASVVVVDLQSASAAAAVARLQAIDVEAPPVLVVAPSGVTPASRKVIATVLEHACNLVTTSPSLLLALRRVARRQEGPASIGAGSLTFE
jgi:signal transduction histidine kinase/sugar lactone lactonase YvrE